MEEDTQVRSERRQVDKWFNKVLLGLCAKVGSSAWYEERRKHLDRVEKRIYKADLSRLYIIENQLRNLPVVDNMVTKVENLILKGISEEGNKVPETLRKDGDDLRQHLMNIIKENLLRDVAERELRDTVTEIKRTQLQVELFVLLTEAAGLELTFCKEDDERLAGMKSKLRSKEILSEEEIAERRDLLCSIRRSYAPLNPVTKEEKIEIVKAMGFTKGHWFKCPKGHIYAIGECGGAMQRANCPECGSSIGGANHQLESGNTLASEMDGAQYAAWSEQANMANYAFN